LISLKNLSLHSIIAFFEKMLHFVLFTSVFSSLCALVLCMATERLIMGQIHQFMSPLHFFIVGSTLFVYNVHYLVKKSTVALSDQYAWVQQHRIWNYIFLLLGLFFCFASVSNMPKPVWQASIVLSVFSFAYSLPVLPFKNKQRLKDIGWLKIVILALVWTSVSAALPILYWGKSLFDYPYEILLRFVFLFILCLAFDIRDMQVDLEAGIYTLPNKFGVKNTYRLIHILSALFLVLSFAQFIDCLMWDRLLFNLLTVCSMLWGVYYVRKHPSDKNYLLFVDGQMLLNGFLIWLL
jgi:4-hydroxybenzoate polyprenyltransferase